VPWKSGGGGGAMDSVRSSYIIMGTLTRLEAQGSLGVVPLQRKGSRGTPRLEKNTLKQYGYGSLRKEILVFRGPMPPKGSLREGAVLISQKKNM